MIILESKTFIDKANLFSGIALSEKAIVRTQKGFSEYVDSDEDPNDFIAGKYAYSLWVAPEEKVVRADSEGQEVIYYYNDGDFWAYSNSFYVLVWYLVKSGINLELDFTALAQFVVSAAALDQPISQDLAVKNIRFLDKSKELRVKGEELLVYDRAPIVDDGVNDFAGMVNKFVTFNRRLVKWMLENHYPVNIELSGGLDSRVFAGIASLYSSNDKLGYISQKSKADDYLIAEQLVRSLGRSSIVSSAEKSGAHISCSDEARWFAYYAGNVGVCQTVKSLPGSRSLRPTFRVSGGGGEVGAAFFGGAIEPYLKVIERSVLAEPFKDRLKDRLISTVSSYNEGIQDNLIEFYRDYRYRFFAGKGWYRDLSLLSFSPFGSLLFTKIVDSPGLESFFGKDRNYIFSNSLINLYLISKTNPTLAYFISDKKTKSFSIEDIRLVESLADLDDGVSGDFKVYGSLFEKIDFIDQECIAEYETSSILSGINVSLSFESQCQKIIAKNFTKIEKLKIINDDALVFLNDSVSKGSAHPGVVVGLFHLAAMLDLLS